MAVYHLHASVGSKGSGKGAGGKARYLLREGPYATAREQVVEGATVRAVEIDKAVELVYAESGNMPVWAADNPVLFWDASDRYERANGSVFREVEISLPEELAPEDQIELAREFAWKISQTGDGPTPWTLAIHAQDPQHPNRRHAHILLSDKVMDGIDRPAEQFFRRYNSKAPAKGGAKKTQERGFQRGKNGEPDRSDWIDSIRLIWERAANQALEKSGYDARIDHRTLEEQRQELEALAKQETDREKRWALEDRADALDRPPQPKKGRVLTHAGPEKAPDRAAMVIEYEKAKAARWESIKAKRTAEQEAEQAAEELARLQAIRDAQRKRQEQRDERVIRSRWNIRRNDRATAAEQRPGIRHPQREQWVAWRRKLLTAEYGTDLAEKLAPWVRVTRTKGGLLSLTNREIDVVDRGDRVVARNGGTDREIEAMILIIKAKGWTNITLTGPVDFQEKLGRAVLAAGLDLADADLKGRLVEAEKARQKAEAEAMHLENHQRLDEAGILAVFAEKPREEMLQVFFDETDGVRHFDNVFIFQHENEFYGCLVRDGKEVIALPVIDIDNETKQIGMSNDDFTLVMQPSPVQEGAVHCVLSEGFFVDGSRHSTLHEAKDAQQLDQQSDVSKAFCEFFGIDRLQLNQESQEPKDQITDQYFVEQIDWDS